MSYRYLALLVAACSPAPQPMPWLHGLDNVVSSTGIAAPRAPADPDLAPDCGVGASRTIELVADVAPAAGRETIVASYSGGIAVFDREDRLVAETSGYRCEGSYDELDVVAFGSAYSQRVLAIAATSGGRRETATWVGLFRIEHTVEPVFTAVVEIREDDTIHRGAIVLLPGGLLYKRPQGRWSLWKVDHSRIYIPVLPDPPHGEPPAVSLLSER